MSSSLTIRVVCLVVVLLAVFSQAEAGWWCGKNVDCKWSNWSPWSSCSHQCGGTGIRDRSRYHNPPQKCKGSACHGSSHESQACNRHCYQGVLSLGHCVCYPNYHGLCCQYYVRYYYCLSTQLTLNICITFVQYWTNVEDVEPTLYNCCTNVLRLLGNAIAK